MNINGKLGFSSIITYFRHVPNLSRMVLIGVRAAIPHGEEGNGHEQGSDRPILA